MWFLAAKVYKKSELLRLADIKLFIEEIIKPKATHNAASTTPLFPFFSNVLVAFLLDLDYKALGVLDLLNFCLACEEVLKYDDTPLFSYKSKKAKKHLLNERGRKSLSII